MFGDLGLNEDFSMSITLFLFMLLVDLWNGLIRIRLWDRMCDPFVKEWFLTSIPVFSQKYPTLQCQQYWLPFTSFSLIGKNVPYFSDHMAHLNSCNNFASGCFWGFKKKNTKMCKNFFRSVSAKDLVEASKDTASLLFCTRK